MRTREEVWAELYGLLATFLSKVGKNDAFGEGDYWLVDEDWGEKQHKICIFRVSVLTPTLVSGMQGLLKRFASDWSIVVSLDVPNLSPAGLIVFADKVQYKWDLVQIRQALGRPDFFL